MRTMQQSMLSYIGRAKRLIPQSSKLLSAIERAVRADPLDPRFMNSLLSELPPQVRLQLRIFLLDRQRRRFYPPETLAALLEGAKMDYEFARSIIENASGTWLCHFVSPTATMRQFFLGYCIALIDDADGTETRKLQQSLKRKADGINAVEFALAAMEELSDEGRLDAFLNASDRAIFVHRMLNPRPDRREPHCYRETLMQALRLAENPGFRSELLELLRGMRVVSDRFTFSRGDAYDFGWSKGYTNESMDRMFEFLARLAARPEFAAAVQRRLEEFCQNSASLARLLEDEESAPPVRRWLVTAGKTGLYSILALPVECKINYAEFVAQFPESALEPALCEVATDVKRYAPEVVEMIASRTAPLAVYYATHAEEFNRIAGGDSSRKAACSFAANFVQSCGVRVQPFAVAGIAAGVHSEFGVAVLNALPKTAGDWRSDPRLANCVPGALHLLGSGITDALAGSSALGGLFDRIARMPDTGAALKLLGTALGAPHLRDAALRTLGQMVETHGASIRPAELLGSDTLADGLGELRSTQAIALTFSLFDRTQADTKRLVAAAKKQGAAFLEHAVRETVGKPSAPPALIDVCREQQEALFALVRPLLERELTGAEVQLVVACRSAAAQEAVLAHCAAVLDSESTARLTQYLAERLTKPVAEAGAESLARIIEYGNDRAAENAAKAVGRLSVQNLPVIHNALLNRRRMHGAKAMHAAIATALGN